GSRRVCNPMDAILRDIRYGFRSLVQNPGLTLVAVVVLTFGIGLTTAGFSIVYGAILKGLPFPGGERIVEVYRNNPSQNARRMGVPFADYLDYRAQQHSFEAFAAYYSGTVNVSGTGDAERYTGSWVTASTFDVAFARPVLGRVFRPGEDAPGGGAVAVIGYGMWQRRFGGDRGVVGRVLRANGAPFTIVGVMPAEYRFPDNADLWLPLQFVPAAKRDAGQWLTVAGKLRRGVTPDQATADLSVIARRLQQQYPETNKDIGAVAERFVDAEIGPEPHQLLYTMLGAMFFVLLIACANVANLLLDRAMHKTKEVGIRVALGASRSAVVRQFLTEAFVLSATAAVLGTGLAAVGINLFNRAIVDSQPPFFIDIRLHPAVLLFAVGVSLLATVLSGAIPAFQSSRTDINEVLKDESRGSSSLHIGRMSRSLVVFEIALSCGLLVAAGLMIKSVTRLSTMDPGFRTENVFTARLGFPAGYTDTLMQRRFFEDLRDRLAQLPGARSAAITSGLPGVQSNGGNFTVDGATYNADRDVPNARWAAVTPRFFETFAIPILQGRGILATDRPETDPVAVVNRSFADRFFPNANPIGRRIRQGGRTSTQPWMTIVGIVPTTFSGNPDEPLSPGYFTPLWQHHQYFASIAVLTAGEPMALTSAVRGAVTSLNPDIPLYWVYSMREALARPTWYIRVFGTMFMILGLIALFIAAVGLYAVMAFSVSRRTREVGIRMALGAGAGDVIGLIFRQGAWQLGVGMLLGLALSASIAQLMRVILFEVRPRDPAIFGGVVAVLAASGLIACLIPARRATRVDPLLALRSE
ncbi:MAG TPA: ABC transporter permease, partial [Gemmatimonadales bacterium]|nr:ABC transporter permease [Gemmatimonadales bacterium]